MINRQQLEIELQTIAKRNSPFKREQVTQDIKKLFASIFIEHYKVYANKIGDDPWDFVTDIKEYLFDLVVVKEEKSSNDKVPFITETILALESELDRGFKQAIDDFQKLLISNAGIKVFVFKCHSSDFQTYLSYITENISRYQQANGHFYLICYINDKLEFTITEIAIPQSLQTSSWNVQSALV